MKKSKKKGTFVSEIPNLQVYTIKTLLIGRISIGPINRPIRGVPVLESKKKIRSDLKFFEIFWF